MSESGTVSIAGARPAHCACPAPLLYCDPVLGCVCPVGRECGDGAATSRPWLAHTQASVGTAIIVIIALLLLIIFTILIYQFHRRRLRKVRAQFEEAKNSAQRKSRNRGEQRNCSRVKRPAGAVNTDAGPDKLVSTGLSAPDKHANYNSGGRGSADSQQVPPVPGQQQVAALTSGPVQFSTSAPCNNLPWPNVAPLQAGEEDYESYDHLDHSRSNNEVAPNYCAV